MARIEFNGIQDVLEGLNQLGQRAIQTETRILKESAKVVQVKASQNARPHRSIYRKKHLDENIKISRIIKGVGGKFILIGPSKGDNSEFFYGKFVEWGTSKMSAKPFLEPALNDSYNEIMEKARSIVREAIGT